MSTFNYQMTSSTSGDVTARPVLGDQLLQSTVTTVIAKAACVEPHSVELVIKMFLDTIMNASSRSQWSPGLYQRLAFRPACDGHPHSGPCAHSADELGAGITLAFTSHAIREWRVGLNPEPVKHEKPAAKTHAAGTADLHTPSDAAEQLSDKDAAGLLAAVH